MDFASEKDDKPAAPAAASAEVLHRFKVLGRTTLTRAQTVAAVGEFEHAVGAWDGVLAECFNPHQALRVRSNGQTYDLLICYSCRQLYIYSGEKLVDTLGVTGSAAGLNTLLAEAKVPLPHDDEKEAAIERERNQTQSKRWFEAMPPAIRPVWQAAALDEAHIDLKPLSAALAREFPDTPARVRALFGWYGSGAGPWSGFPAYESAAGTLLLDYTTPELISAAQDPGLTAVEVDGAARLFGEWGFSRQRPADLRMLPPALKARLLDRALETGDQDKHDRATRAFKQP